MYRTQILAFIVVAIGIGFALATAGHTQIGPPKAFVALQPNSPGTSQSGHLNVSGTVKASAFQGAGSGLTGVPWNAISGAPGTLLTLPFEYTGPAVDPFRITNTASDGSGMASWMTSPTGSVNALVGVVFSPNGNGVHGSNSASTGVNSGVTGIASSPQGRGVSGIATSSTGSPFGVFGSTSTVNGVGVYGLNSADFGVGVKGEGRDYGVHGRATSGFGGGVLGETAGADGKGVVGFCTSESGQNTAIYGETNSPDGFASKLIGRNYLLGNTGIGAVPSADRLKVMGGGGNAAFIHNSGSGRAIEAISGFDTGIWSRTTTGPAGVDGWNSNPTGFGVAGQALATTGVNYGLFGFSASPDGWGVWSSGRMGSSGTKSFRIDHPLDPETKYLLHYSSESPEPQNFYNGTITTDERGEAWVQLPDYFESINREFRYQLTVLDESEFALARVAKKIANNRFLIKTNRPRVEVSWEVKAIRNDPWMQRYGAATEVEKQGPERGFYLHPELYGQPDSRRAFRPSESQTNSLKSKGSKGGNP